MVRPDFAKWNDSAGEMLRLAVEAEEPRDRERYLALYQVGSCESNASQWAKASGREPETVMEWIHRYNSGGRAAVAYRHSGGVRKALSQSEQEQIVEVVRTSKPIAHKLPGHGWNLKKLCRWVEAKLQRKVSRNTVRTVLKQFGLSWKKCKKLLTKANAKKRAEFVEQFQTLYERMCRNEVTLVYIDEAHIHQDLDLGYTWSPIGEPTWVDSTSPGLSARINALGGMEDLQRALDHAQ